MRRRETPPGQTLCEIAELLFGAEPLGQGLLALIADAQQEWTGTTSRVGRVRVRVRLLTAFWQSVLLYARHRATRPPNARVAASIALSVVLFSLSAGGMHLWLTGGDWHEVIRQMLFSMPLLVAIPLSNAGDTFVAAVSDRNRWRTFHQFTVCWVALATWWIVVTGDPGWVPIGSAVSAISARAIAAWLQHRRGYRAVKE